MEFIERRYRVSCVIPLTVHCFIQALSEHHTQNTVCYSLIPRPSYEKIDDGLGTRLGTLFIQHTPPITQCLQACVQTTTKVHNIHNLCSAEPACLEPHSKR